MRPDGRGVIVRHVEGGENAPPSSEALELRDVDTDLPKIELGPEWGAEAGATVPVIRSKLHGHRGIRSFDPARVEFVSLPPSYYEHPVSCATAAQAAGIRSAFSNAACLRDPSDPRTIAFTILPTHGLVTVERWVPGKAPFGELLEAMDAGQLEVEDRVPQGWHTYEPATSEHRHELVDPTSNLADDPLDGLGEPVRPGRAAPPLLSQETFGQAPSGRPTSQWCPNGSSIRPSSQPCSSAAGYTSRAPAATARAITARGSSTTSASRIDPAAERLGTEVAVVRRLVRDPERGIADRELRDDLRHLVRAADAVVLDRPERLDVPGDRLAPAPHRELRPDPRHWRAYGTPSAAGGVERPTSPTRAISVNA